MSQNSNELHKALGDYNIEKVKQIIEEDISVLNSPNPRGSTPVAVAASRGQSDIVVYLIKKGADVKKANDFGSTPLHYAAWASDLESFKNLKAKGASIYVENINGNTPLQFACLGGNIDIMNLCISEGMDIKAKLKDGSSLIHWAAYGGNLDMFKFLESQGLKYNAKDKDNSGPVFWAASGNAINIVKYLIEEKNIAVNIKDDLGNIPLGTAAEKGNIEIVNYLLEKGADINHKKKDNVSIMLLASNSNKPELIKLLIDKGLNVNVFDDFGNTPLITASAHGNLEMVKILVENGASLDPGVCKRESCTNSGQTPLHCASWRNPAIVEYLIKKGSDVNKKDIDGSTALHYAMVSDSLKTIKLLCSNGADINAQNNLGVTPLMKAIKKKKPESVKVLLKNKADLSVVDNNGKTALHYAAITGFGEISDILLEYKADINAKDKKGRNPAYYAVYYGNKKMAEDFFERGANNKDMPYKKTKLLNKDLNEGEAAIWYLNHSGWAIKTKNHFIVFDYWQRNNPDFKSINNGRINPTELKNQNVMVFSSHTHGDHYSKEIFEWTKEIKNINYILGFETEDFKDYSYIPPRKVKTIDNVKITPIRSTDSGEGFMIEVDGLTIYHPGDHANRYQKGDKEFTEEIDFLAEKYKKIDVAFVPITGCSFRDKKALVKGNDYLVNKFKPSLVLPMHGSDNEHKYKEYSEKRNDPVYKYVLNKGDRLLYKKDNTKIVSNQ